MRIKVLFSLAVLLLIGSLLDGGLGIAAQELTPRNAAGSPLPSNPGTLTAPASPSVPSQPLGNLLCPDGTLDLYGYRGSVDARGWQLSSGLGDAPRFTATAGSLLAPGDHWDGRFSLTGVDGTINSLALDGSGNLYAAGPFVAGNGAAYNIARWDGSTWSALGTGIQGNFDPPDTVAVDGSGTAGGPMIPSPPGPHEVQVLAVDAGGNLYAGGYFFSAGGVPVSGLARWDGTAWSDVGGGVGGPWGFSVSALAFDANGNLYVGGYFTSAGGAPISGLARWDGTAWSAVSGWEGGGVSALAFDSSGALYVGGRFDSAGGMPVHNIARWDGSTWSDVSGGVGGSVNALAADGSDSLYVGGKFISAGGKISMYIAHWSNTTPLAADDVYVVDPNATLVVAPPGLLRNDVDGEGDPLSARLLAPPVTGTLVLSAGGAFTYTPPLSFSGVVTFTYQADEGPAVSAPATVRILVGMLDQKACLQVVLKGAP